MDPLLLTLLGAVGGKALELACARINRLGKNILVEHKASTDVQLLKELESCRVNPLLIDYLEYHLEATKAEFAGHPVRLFRRNIEGNELKIPVAFLGNISQDALGHPPDITKKKINISWSKSEFIKFRTRLSNRSIDNNLLFSAKELNWTPGEVSLTGGLTDYCSALSCQDGLEWELLGALRKHLLDSNADAPFEDIRNELVNRTKVELAGKDYIERCAVEYNGLAISTVIIYPDNNGRLVALCGKRSNNTAAHPGLFHVIPACMFQPELGDPKIEWSIKHNVLKEYGEELYQYDLNKGAEASYFYKDCEGVTYLLGGLDSGSCEFHITGLVMNLLNLRPEICTLLLIKDQDWWEEKPDFKTNWEYAERQQILEQDGRVRTTLNVAKAESEFEEYFGCSDGEWVPSGLAAFWLGIDKARYLTES